MNEDNDEDYPVGYGRPPKHMQFKKGQSGNPAGRPKKNKSVKEMFDEEFQTIITIGGREMTKVRAYVLLNMNAALKGNPNASRLVMSFLTNDENNPEDFDPTFDDEVELKKLGERLQRRNKEGTL